MTIIWMRIIVFNGAGERTGWGVEATTRYVPSVLRVLRALFCFTLFSILHFFSNTGALKKIAL